MPAKSAPKAKATSVRRRPAAADVIVELNPYDVMVAALIHRADIVEYAAVNIEEAAGDTDAEGASTLTLYCMTPHDMVPARVMLVKADDDETRSFFPNIRNMQLHQTHKILVQTYVAAQAQQELVEGVILAVREDWGPITRIDLMMGLRRMMVD